ncbi:MAG: bifunctional DNA-formamidopyrimidine glycosylase/DNA-(apurinic or apyrimidinic site) lyase [Planctomycetota bacterium]|nr:MAG: bifunctional DNA-formamidopyrimidine glycosylase/DNA-(apurinic or apyrimidinic site) lyase [Planctomycetota bacterium]
MPELPEVERLQRELEERLRGAQLRSCALRRADYARPTGARLLPRAARIDQVRRRGKQLALCTDRGPCLRIALGMTGSLRLVAAHSPQDKALAADPHVHAQLRLRSDSGEGQLLTLHVRDPRRFGWLEPFPSVEALEQGPWSRFGPEALTIDARTLTSQLARTNRSIKAALLDQRVLAGVGNIYADEALHRAGVDPRRAASSLQQEETAALAKALRTILRQAIARGGSTIRDYAALDGSPGRQQHRHRVYGRAGLPCCRCARPLTRTLVAGRTTVWCTGCQH